MFLRTSTIFFRHPPDNLLKFRKCEVVKLKIVSSKKDQTKNVSVCGCFPEDWGILGIAHVFVH